MHGDFRAKKVILRHRVRKVRNNRVCKEKQLIKRKARRHIEHEARETQEHVGHEAGEVREHVGHVIQQTRSKVFEHLPTFFLQYTVLVSQSNNFSKIFQVNNFQLIIQIIYIYINWANTSFSIIPGTILTLKLPIKSQTSPRQLFFSDVVLASHYHGSKGEEKQ